MSVVRRYSRVWGTSLPNTIVKNNVVQNCVETGIEGPYELVYHNTVKNTGENSVARYTGSTEAIYIKPTTEFEQKYIGNTIETRGLRCFSSYSNRDDEYKGIYILNNSVNLKIQMQVLLAITLVRTLKSTVKNKEDCY